MRTKPKILWPWLRKARSAKKASIDRLIRESTANNHREANRLRNLGASEDAVWRHCYFVGHPRNSKWRRFRMWFVGDFMLLHILNEHLKQTQLPNFPKNIYCVKRRWWNRREVEET